MMVDTCNALVGAGLKVEVLVISGMGLDLLSYLNSSIPSHIIGRRHRWDCKAAWRIVHIARGAQIVHVHMRHNFRYLMLLRRVFGIDTPIVFHDHYGSIQVDHSVPFGFKTIFKPTHYIGASPLLTNWAQEKLQLPKKAVFLLENSVLPYPAIASNPLKDLVLVSNLKPLKNQIFAIDLANQGGWTLDLIGGEQDLAYVGEIKSMQRKCLKDNQVTLISDCTFPQRLLHHYRLGLHTSLSETGPLAIIEYLAQGLPFLAYRTGAAAEKISKEFPDFFIRNFDTVAWQERISQLLEEIPDKEKMRWVFEKHFSQDTYIQSCMQIYRGISTRSEKSD